MLHVRIDSGYRTIIAQQDVIVVVNPRVAKIVTILMVIEKFRHRGWNSRGKYR